MTRSVLGKRPDRSPNTIQPFWTLRDHIVMLANGEKNLEIDSGDISRAPAYGGVYRCVFVSRKEIYAHESRVMTGTASNTSFFDISIFC